MRIWPVLIAVFLSSAGVALAANTGSIRLTVVDSSGGPIAGAGIDIRCFGAPGHRTAIADARGTAVIGSLPPGAHEITASRDGLVQSTRRVEVRQNETSDVTLTLAVGAIAESVMVLSPAPIVSTNTAMVSKHITLEEVERIPVGRDYLAYAQLVPGVGVVANGGGTETPIDPASKAGNNYSDRGGNPGSRDNIHLLEGFNVSDLGNSGASLDFNNEVILESQVITSGIAADTYGSKGFLGNVVTKSGSNVFQGSANFYLRDSSWYADYETGDDRLKSARDDQQDYAFTLGGPVVRDRMSFFVSAQKRDSDGDIELSSSAVPEPQTSTYRFERTNLFLKTSLTPSSRDSISAFYYVDQRDTSGSKDVNAPPNTYTITEERPELLNAQYVRVIDSAWLLDIAAGLFERTYDGKPAYPELGPSNTILYVPGTEVPAYQRNLGSSGGESTFDTERVQATPSVSWNISARGVHVLRAGMQYYDWTEELSNHLLDGYSLTSLAPIYAGMTFGETVSNGIFPQGEFDYILRALQAEPSSAAFAFVDANKDGVITASELGAISFSSSAGNLDGINYLRVSDVRVGVNKVEAENWNVYVEDDWTMGRFNVRAGLRVEDWKYIASDGSTIVDMDPVYSPRVGVAWDVKGDGRQRLSFFYGRYYDPLLSPIVRFAGNLSGTVQAEQIFIGNDWFDYRTRGSITRSRDAVFAPNLENQHQDEYALTWGLNLSPTVGFMAQGYFRRDGNIIEDYDPVYFNEAVAGDLALTPQQFGFGPEGPVGANYFVANLVGAKRETWGLDLSLERAFSATWGGSIHYSWKDAKGNSNSDGHTDLQGDFLNLDPRLDYMWGSLPGSVDHQVKLFGSYRTPIRLELGALLYWSSGAHYTEADIF
ncbi:MAG: carboxypeptidase-like regulatory domain-containing protein, partial [Thermoanaerobaculia bacterium]|nr:carboxypeptidase-like regulatory domain-containing protein [Thermoanaerobaculia bacterium]